MSDQRFFQYIDGESKGEVVLFDKIAEEDGMVFVEFKDGRRCNEELILPLNDPNKNKFHLMAEVSDSNNIWTFKTEWVGRKEERWSEPEDRPDGKQVCIQPFEEGKKREIPIPPQSVVRSKRQLNPEGFGNIDVIRNTPVVNLSAQPQAAEIPQNTNDPVWQMMDAAKKFPTTVGVEMDIMLPKKSLFDVANESFENGGEKVIEYIIENLDISRLKEALRNALYEAYGAKKVDVPKEIDTGMGDMVEEEEDEKVEEVIDSGEPEALEEPIIREATAQEAALQEATVEESIASEN